MFLKLLILFTLLPLMELLILLKVGALLGFVNTLLVVISTAAIGAFLAKKQGVSTLKRIQQQLSTGSLPAAELLDGLIILVAGVLLITPGILTDLCGFLLLIPSTRTLFTLRLKAHLQNRIHRAGVQTWR